MAEAGITFGRPVRPFLRTGRAGLVGRVEEMAQLAASLERAAAGEQPVVLVSGEPGIGKTRLLDYFCRAAERDGARVLRGSGYEAEGIPPYLPFIEALRPACRSLPVGRLRRLLGPAAGEVARWLPELRERLGPLPPSYRLSQAEARLRLFDGVVAFLANLAGEAPLVLLLDDLQWADTGSVDFLAYLARKARPARLLILGAHREVEPEGTEPLGRVIAELTRHRLLTRIVLRRLSAEDTARLLADLLGGDPSPALARQIYQQSEGNPFFAEEFLKFLLEEGRIRERAGRWEVAGDGTTQLPPSIRATILARCARLAPGCFALLQTAAVVGRWFPPRLLARATGTSEDAVEGHLRDAERAGLAARGPHEEWGFVHDKIREALYAEITQARRRRLHGLIGRALERGARSGRAVPTAELAFHFGRSEEPAKGIAWSLAAGDEAMATHACGEAVTHYRTALGLLGWGGARGGGAREKAGLYLKLGEAQTAVADYRGALESYERALAIARRGNDRAGIGRALRRIGAVHARQEELDRALSCFHQALAAWKGVRDREVVELLVQMGTTHTVSRAEYRPGARYSEQAVALAARLGDRHLQAIASLSLGNTRVRMNDLEEGERLLRTAFALALEADDPATAAEASASLAVYAYWTADLEASRRATVEREALAKRCGDLYQLRHVYPWLAFLAYSRGEWAEAERWLREADPILDRLDSPEPRAFRQKIEAEILYQRGRLLEAERLLDRAMQSFRQIGPGVLVWYLGLLGLARLDLGRTDDARVTFAELEELVGRLPAGSLPCAPALNFLGTAAVRLGDAVWAARCYERLLAYPRQHHYLLTDRVLGMLAAFARRWPEAEAHFATATGLARRHRIRPELGLTLLESARMRLARGAPEDRERAPAELREALDLFSALGMTRAEAEARALVPAAAPAARGTGARLPGALTARQVEVLRLVAEGQSNREIAGTLGVSEKTVINHLTAIFNRTGVDNRAAATAFAFRHGLL